MTSLPPVADPTSSFPPSASSPPFHTVNPTVVVPSPPVVTTVPSPVAPAPEATAVALAAAAAAADPQVSCAESANSDLVPKVTGKAASKKKKNQVSVSMAVGSNSLSGSQGAQGENTGRWTAEEHRLFLQGLELHGKGWKKIAGLIKSRTVVQIRTHAQKYFQKMAKAKQNGEEGEIVMDARGGSAIVPSVTTTVAQSNKRRKQTSGTKRKAIESVVASAQFEAKKMLIGSGDGQVGITSVAPALIPYVLPVVHPMEDESHGTGSIPSITTAHGTISGPALEDSLYVYQPWLSLLL
jgi:SHAQKYF class myb-like DNA-binding protein